MNHADGNVETESEYPQAQALTSKLDENHKISAAQRSKENAHASKSKEVDQNNKSSSKYQIKKTTYIYSNEVSIL